MIRDFEGAYERTMDLHRHLREAWLHAREEWTDVVSVEFDQTYWHELDLQLSRLLSAANDLLRATRRSQ
jgi:hypothetical protein